VVGPLTAYPDGRPWERSCHLQISCRSMLPLWRTVITVSRTLFAFFPTRGKRILLVGPATRREEMAISSAMRSIFRLISVVVWSIYSFRISFFT
jgi:hypothetical protein